MDLDRLPDPILELEKGGALFQVYRAKDIYKETWNHEALYSLVIQARHSYLRYGSVPILDEYDPKAAIYLVRASYRHEGRLIEEWMSNRFIPGDGDPRGSGDLHLFAYCGIPVARYLEEWLFEGMDGYEKHIVTSSRTSGIPPQIVSSEGFITSTLPRKHKYAAQCYALMNKGFLQDARILGLPFRYMDGIVKDEFVTKVLSISGISPLFTPAYQTLGLSNPRDIHLDRKNKWPYLFCFPLYFLNTKEFFHLLRTLIRKGEITEHTLRLYLGVAEDLDILNQTDETLQHKLKHLGSLLTREGPIEGSTLTGQELRDLIDQNVSDGPELKITNIETWTQSIDALIRIPWS